MENGSKMRWTLYVAVAICEGMEDREYFLLGNKKF